MPGLLNSLIGLPQTEIGLELTLMDKRFGLVIIVCSLLLCRLRLPAAAKKSTPLRVPVARPICEIVNSRRLDAHPGR